MRASFAAAVVLAGASSIGPAFAEDPVSFKDKTITIVVGFTPGGTPDVISRAAAEQMAKRLPGKPAVIVRNVPGAEGVVALNAVVAQTKPDGLTLVTGRAAISIRSTIATHVRSTIRRN
jgi:tripartite-type tricarboxylate transporter receptor subunit TctC